MPITQRNSPKPRESEFQTHLKRLEKTFRKTEEQYKLLGEINQAILRVTGSLDEVFHLITFEGIKKTNSSSGEIMLVKHDLRELIKVFPPDRWTHNELSQKSLYYKAILDNENKNIGDVKDTNKYPEIKEGYHNFKGSEIKSELVVLIKPENSERILGVLKFEREKKGEFSEEEVEWAELLASQAAIAIRHQQLWEGIQTLNQITVSLVAEKLSPQQAFQDIIAKIVEWTDCEECYILQKDGDEFLVIGSKEKSDFGIRVKRESLISHALLDNEYPNIFNESVLQETKFKDFNVYAKNRDIQSVLIIPLLDQNKVIGALYLDDSRKDHFSDFVTELLKVLGGVLSKTLSVTSRIAAESQSELIDKAKYILSQLESVKDNFTHRYGSNIGDSRGKLLELKKFLGEFELPNIPNRDMSVPNFIDWVVANLVNQKDELLKFNKEYDTKHIVKNTHPMDLLKLAEDFLQSSKKQYPHIKFIFENKIPDGFRSGIYISSFCRLNQLIKDVFANLVENAVQAIEKSRNAKNGEIKFTIKIEAPHNITLEMKDNGIGISKEVLPKIFKGYSSKTDPDLHGKGLSFCNLYVWAHGGRIEVESSEGNGAIFKLTFPTVQKPKLKDEV